MRLVGFAMAGKSMRDLSGDFSAVVGKPMRLVLQMMLIVYLDNGFAPQRPRFIGLNWVFKRCGSGFGPCGTANSNSLKLLQPLLFYVIISPDQVP